MMNKELICPICGKTTFGQLYDYDICKFCGWENDGYYEAGGANEISREEYTLEFYYDSNDSPVGFCYNGNDYYYRKNLQGDIIAILNTSGTKVVEYSYNAWGEVLSVTGSLSGTIGRINPFRYRGYYYDSETGLYYLQSRYYDPVVSRFLNADDVRYIQSFNKN